MTTRSAIERPPEDVTSGSPDGHSLVCYGRVMSADMRPHADLLPDS
ncbi:hypothetical protein [Antribacter gilvus]|nr:hypothetical protein [Antribacter gilvus]